MLAPKVTPTLVHFQAVTVGESSSGQVVTLRNLTTSPISVNAVQLIGPGAAEFQFTLSKPTPFQLAPGAAATAEVFSTPLTKGLHGARLQFVHGGRPAVQTARPP